jgi:short-subunit dehydrogenase
MKSGDRPLALVTGASSGIGASLARELAKDGHDMVLVARRVGPMRALAEELKADGANSIIIAIDLSKVGAAASLVQDIKARGLTIDVLINAAGLGTNGPFDASDPFRVSEMLQVNVVALTELTRMLLPDMVAKRRGKIMLMASTAAFQPGPQMAVYCASKAYVLSFGEAIAYELRDSGVTITTLCPGATDTEFARVADASGAALFKGSLLPVMTASDVARIGYRGFRTGRRVVVAGWINKITAIVSRLSPIFVSLRISNWMISSSK